MTNSSKPAQNAREFWLHKNRGFDECHDLHVYSSKHSLIEDQAQIHVVEYSAFEALQAQLDIAMKALDFYSDERNYGVGEFIFKKTDVMADMGKTACEALDEIAKMRGGK